MSEFPHENVNSMRAKIFDSSSTVVSEQCLANEDKNICLRMIGIKRQLYKSLSQDMFLDTFPYTLPQPNTHTHTQMIKKCILHASLEIHSLH